jgi:hypothetical protein
MVRAKHLTPESLLAAMRRGDFYASSGVTLDDVFFDESTRTLQLAIAAREGATYTTQFIGTLEDYDRHSEAVLDAAGEHVPATRRYSADVGRTLSTHSGLNPAYQLTGRELYIRATVTSSLAPENPAWEGQKQQAWTQVVVGGRQKGEAGR